MNSIKALVWDDPESKAEQMMHQAVEYIGVWNTVYDEVHQPVSNKIWRNTIEQIVYNDDI